MRSGARLEELGGAVPQQHGRQVAGRRPAQPASDQVELRVDARAGQLGGEVVDHPVQPGQRLGRRLLRVDGRPAQQVAQLGHPGRGLRVVAGGVADDDRHLAVGQRERVVPVAADGQSLHRRHEARRQREPRDDRERRQQAALQGGRDAALQLAQPHPGQRQPGGSGDVAQPLGVSVVEAASAATDGQHAEQVVAADQPEDEGLGRAQRLGQLDLACGCGRPRCAAAAATSAAVSRSRRPGASTSRDRTPTACAEERRGLHLALVERQVQRPGRAERDDAGHQVGRLQQVDQAPVGGAGTSTCARSPIARPPSTAVSERTARASSCSLDAADPTGGTLERRAAPRGSFT